MPQCYIVCFQNMSVPMFVGCASNFQLRFNEVYPSETRQKRSSYVLILPTFQSLGIYDGLKKITNQQVILNRNYKKNQDKGT